MVQQYYQLMPGTAYFFQKIAAFIEHHPQQTHAKNSHKHGVEIQLAQASMIKYPRPSLWQRIQQKTGPPH